jgi:hypothetical protein
MAFHTREEAYESGVEDKKKFNLSDDWTIEVEENLTWHVSLRHARTNIYVYRSVINKSKWFAYFSEASNIVGEGTTPEEAVKYLLFQLDIRADEIERQKKRVAQALGE